MKKNVLLNYSYTDKCIDSIDGEIFLQSLSKLSGFEKVVFVNNVGEILKNNAGLNTFHYLFK